MSQEHGLSEDATRKVLPIEKGFPIENVNIISEQEARGIAKPHYRPIYTMHKWWARRLGCVFRTICLYSLADNPSEIEVYEPGENTQLDDFNSDEGQISDALSRVTLENPDSLWEFYPKDVRINNKKILDPFMGGGTSLVEASRFGADVVGNDLNPVAWFISKKELDTHETEISDLKQTFSELSDKVEQEIKQFYKTPCPNDDHNAEVIAYLWVKNLDCTSCGESVPLFNDFRVAKGRYDHKGEQIVVCPECSEFVYVDDWQSECTCSECSNEFTPKDGNIQSNGRKYVCPDCGQKYGILDAVDEQDGYDTKLYGLEYYCETCSESSALSKGDYKSYRAATDFDRELFEKAKQEWESSPELKEYAPDYGIRRGWKTSSTDFEGSAPGGGNLSIHKIEKWTDMFNERHLLSLTKLLRGIDSIDDDNLREYLLLCFSDSMRGNSILTTYQTSSNAIDHVFKSNSFDPPKRFAENNPWGAEEGARNFVQTFDRVLKGVQYGSEPFDRYPDKNGDMVKSEAFQHPVGEESQVYQGDIMDLDYEDEFDAVITDPPYYHNVMYSELSDYFYVWQRKILSEEYEWFKPRHTPRAESIVSNPAEGKGEKEFEEELTRSFNVIRSALKKDGALVFTYHHSDSESWGELLGALCDVGFEVTATYPVTADLDKIEDGESVSFDIIIVARPISETTKISWNSLRRDIYRRATKTRQRLEEHRDLSRGDIGVIEMGNCFREYSKHHGKVKRAGETMTAKEVVTEIYGVIQHGSDIGEIDVFLDLLETPSASYNDLNKLTRGTNATPQRMEDMRLYRMDDGFKLGTWDDEKRIAYVQERVDSEKELTDLDKAQFLRYRWEHGKSVSKYLKTWDITDNLRELCEGLADATGDDTYKNILESRLSDF